MTTTGLLTACLLIVIGGISECFAQSVAGEAAAEPADTVGHELQEVVVEGRTQRLIDNGIEYMPDKNTRKHSTDAIDLLANMMIPQLNVTPGGDVTTAAGQQVKIFIDNVEATEADIRGLRPQDVLRVEVLDYPPDARFKHAEHVVNFIMRKYEWGGYTRLAATGRLLYNERIWGCLYQKFAYRNWVFDLKASGDGTWLRDDKEYSEETFRDFSYGGSRYDEVKRTSQTDRYRARDNNQDVSLRVGYGNDRMYVGHTLFFSRNGQPSSDMASRVEYEGMDIDTTVAAEISKSQTIHTWAVGNYWFALPRENTLQADWTMGMAGIRYDSRYQLGNLDPILNNTHIKNYYPSLTINHSKRLGHGNSIGAGVYSNCFLTESKYANASEKQVRTLSWQTMITANYFHRWDFGLSLTARLGAQYVYGRQDGVDNVHRWHPSGTLSLNYAPNQKNYFGLTGMWYNFQVLSDQADDVTLRQDELMWYRGNPVLRSPEHKYLNLSYSFMPSNRFSMYAWLGYTNEGNSAVYEYKSIDGYDGLVRTYSDKCTEHSLDGAVSLNIRLFKRSLSLSGTAGIRRDVDTGIHPVGSTSFYGSLRASWTYRNFYLLLLYESPKKVLTGNSGFRVWNPQSYGLRATYSLGDFQAQVIFSNWFGNNKSTKRYSSGHYDYYGWNSKNPNVRFIYVTLQYTIPYGKPVKRNEEIKGDAPGANKLPD